MNYGGNWLIGLDFSPIDSDVIAYTSFLAKTLRPENVYFIHVYKDLNIPDSVREQIDGFEEPSDERILHKMESMVESYFESNAQIKTSCLVVEGKPEAQFLHWAGVKQADLIVMGRKQQAGGSGVIPRRVARNAGCSVLFVPKHGPYTLDSLFVPTDFSKASQQAIELATLIRDKAEADKFTLFHSCQIPSVIYYDSLAGSSMDELLRGAAEDQFEELLEKMGIEQVDTLIDSVTNHNPGAVAARHVEECKADLVLISGNNKFGLGRFLLGSSTESMVDNLDSVPLLVVKGQGLYTSIEQGSSLISALSNS